MEPLLVSPRDACALLGIRKTKLFELLRDQKLNRKKIGSRTLITVSSIHALAACE